MLTLLRIGQLCLWGDRVMDRMVQNSHQTQLIGCSVVGLLAILGVVAIFVWVVNHDRWIAHYPDATVVSSHQLVSPTASTVLWNDVYHTSDTIWDIQQWYTQHFAVQLDLSSHTMKDGCLFLRGIKQRYRVERHMSVVLCDTLNGRTISVTRSTLVN